MLGTIRRVGNISRALRAPVAAVFGSEGVSSSPGAHNISEELQVLNSEWLQPIRNLGTQEVNWQEMALMGVSGLFSLPKLLSLT